MDTQQSKPNPLDALIAIRFTTSEVNRWTADHNAAMNRPTGPEKPVVDLLHAAQSAALHYRDPKTARLIVAPVIKAAMTAVDTDRLGRLDAQHVRVQLNALSTALGLEVSA